MFFVHMQPVRRSGQGGWRRPWGAGRPVAAAVAAALALILASRVAPVLVAPVLVALVLVALVLVAPVLVAPVLVAPVLADVVLPPLFSDHMVVQRGRPIVVWGTAAPRARITIRLAGENVATTADSHGRFRAELPPPAWTGPARLEVAGANRLVVDDVVAGEVWLCGGQSNMAWPVRWLVPAEQADARTERPGVRLFEVADPTAPRRDDERWRPAGAAAADRLSALCLFYAAALHERLGVPVGAVVAAVGASLAEAWTPTGALLAEPALGPRVAGFPQRHARYLADHAAGRDPRPHLLAPGSLYEAMIAPLAVGFVVSFVVAWIVVAAFMRFIQTHRFTPFAVYRILLGGVVLATILR